MSFEGEKFVELPKSEFARRIEAKEAEGWVILGKEQLARVKFSASARFDSVPFQTEEDIKKNYMEGLKAENPNLNFEIELVLDEGTQKISGLRKIMNDQEYAEMLTNISDADKSYVVFARVKSK